MDAQPSPFPAPAFPPDAIRACLDRLVASHPFARSRRLVAFLRFVVEATLSGREQEIKERTIAVEVYGRALDYDPVCDPIVRSEAHRLRAKLAAYYAGEGIGDPILLGLPRGRYVPVFRASRAVPAVGRGECRIAVRPLEAEGDEPDLLAFARAFLDGVTSRLSRRPGLRVVGRSGRSALRSGGPLRADFLATGHLEREEAGLRVSMRVARAADGHEIWTGVWSNCSDGLQDAQDEIAERIAGALGSFLIQTGSHPRPASPRAYELYVKGRYSAVQYGNTFDPRHLEPARRRLEAALELDPRFTDAMAELAHLELIQLYPPRGEPSQLMARARPLLEAALAIEPSHARSLCLLGLVEGTSFRRREGLQLTETAVAIDPDDAEARVHLGFLYLSLGFWESAVAACNWALALDPIWEMPHWLRIGVLTMMGELDGARNALDGIRGWIESTEELAIATAHVHLAAGDARTAAAALERATVVAPHRQNLAVSRGLAAALLGDREEAERLLEERKDDPPRLRDSTLQLALALGHEELTRELLDRNPVHRNYRWLLTQRLPPAQLGKPEWRALVEELHGSWQRDLEEIGPRLPAPPPPLPSPAVLLDERAV